jgi:hypothetical protein
MPFKVMADEKFIKAGEQQSSTAAAIGQGKLEPLGVPRDAVCIPILLTLNHILIYPRLRAEVAAWYVDRGFYQSSNCVQSQTLHAGDLEALASPHGCMGYPVSPSSLRVLGELG